MADIRDALTLFPPAHLTVIDATTPTEALIAATLHCIGKGSTALSAIDPFPSLSELMVRYPLLSWF
jgi:hypothetical protein